jgi:hypothetical protein
VICPAWKIRQRGSLQLALCYSFHRSAALAKQPRCYMARLDDRVLMRCSSVQSADVNCDIATPMRRHGTAVLAVDLFADVLVRADAASYCVGDLDELGSAGVQSAGISGCDVGGLAMPLAARLVVRRCGAGRVWARGRGGRCSRAVPGRVGAAVTLVVEVNGVLASAAPFSKPGSCHFSGSLSGSLLRGTTPLPSAAPHSATMKVVSMTKISAAG